MEESKKFGEQNFPNSKKNNDNNNNDAWGKKCQNLKKKLEASLKK